MYGHRHVKRCLTLLIIREMQIKTTMRDHLTPAKTAISKKSTNSERWRWCGGKETLLHCWWQCTLLLWRTVWRVLKKLKRELPYHPAIPRLCVYLEKDRVWQGACTPMLTAALFTNANHGSHRSVHRQMNGWRRRDTRIQWSVTWPWKRMT